MSHAGAGPSGLWGEGWENEPGNGPVPGRVLGLDLGARRIGVALSDDGRRLASPLTTVARSGSIDAPARVRDHQELASIVTSTGANLVVVGLPLSLSGARGPAAEGVVEEVEELRLVLGVPVELSDERFTTVVAQRSLVAGGRRPAARRKAVDKTAAAAILQTWLDRQRSGRRAP